MHRSRKTLDAMKRYGKKKQGHACPGAKKRGKKKGHEIFTIERGLFQRRNIPIRKKNRSNVSLTFCQLGGVDGWWGDQWGVCWVRKQ